MLRKVVRDLSAIAPVSWVLARTLHHVDGSVFRLTRGRYTASSLLAGLPVIMLGTTGAKSGASRTVPVLGIPDGDRTAVVASGYAQSARPPSWYFNLRAHPEAKITVDGLTRHVRAYEAEGEEKERLWRLALETYPGFTDYEKRLGERSIPIMVLAPRR
jgi:deazaflavin-dependent oxidoreductase (nitroreductase family)